MQKTINSWHKTDPYWNKNWNFFSHERNTVVLWKHFQSSLSFPISPHHPKPHIVNYSFLSLKSSLNNPLNRTYILSPSGQVHAAMTFVGSITPDCKTLNSLQAASLHAKNLSVGQSLDDGWQMLLAFACSEGENKQLPTLLTH